MGKKLRTLLFGGAIGAALGVLYAPRAGKKTRAMIADKTESLWGEEAQANGTILGEVAKTTSHAVNAGKSIASEVSQGTIGEIAKGANLKRKEFNAAAADRITEFSQANVRPVFSEKNDELRAKIEAARAKIAAQVASNIKTQEAKTTNAAKKKSTSRATRPAARQAAKPAVKTAAKKTAVRKATNPAARPAAKSAARKTAVKKTAKKAAVKKTAATKTAVKKTNATRSATKKPASKKPAAKKTATKKAAQKRK